MPDMLDKSTNSKANEQLGTWRWTMRFSGRCLKNLIFYWFSFGFVTKPGFWCSSIYSNFHGKNDDQPRDIFVGTTIFFGTSLETEIRLLRKIPSVSANSLFCWRHIHICLDKSTSFPSQTSLTSQAKYREARDIPPLSRKGTSFCMDHSRAPWHNMVMEQLGTFT